MQRNREAGAAFYAKKLESPTSLTEFAPLSSEVKAQGSQFSFSNLFWRNKSRKDINSSEENIAETDDETFKEKKWKNSVPEVVVHSEPLCQRPDDLEREIGNAVDEEHTGLPSADEEDGQGREREILYHRSMTNVLRRIVNILDRKSTTLQDYKDSDFKQYWMPDSNCKECYECGDKFTTFRRRHHCRICGQIFCRTCCNQGIPGRILGYTGDLRVCTYCCKVVLSYIKSLDTGTDISNDFKALQDDLQQKLNLLADTSPGSASFDSVIWGGSVRRKSSMGFREEDLAKAKSDFSSAADLSTLGTLSPERRKISHDNMALADLWAQIQHPLNGVDFQSHRHRLRTYTNCLVGSELVDWMVAQNKAASRAQAVAVGQTLLDLKILECVTSQEQIFIDGYSLYKPGENGGLDSPVFNVEDSATNSNQEGQEPLWVKEIQPTESSSADEDSDDQMEIIDHPIENAMEEKNTEFHRMSSSTSTFYLDIDVKESRVSVSRPRQNGEVMKPDQSESYDACDVSPETNKPKIELEHFGVTGDYPKETIDEEFLQGSFFPDRGDGQYTEEFLTPNCWHNAQVLREENGEKLAFERLNASYETLEIALLRQLLSAEGLSLSWCEVIYPIIHRVVDLVRPDIKHDNDDMDVRQYVKIKKIPGGSKSECVIVNGVGCTKNVAHRKMHQNLVNPTILLLSNSIVYQRVENKLSSLDPIIMQEHEYLKNIVSKITVYKPNVLLVEKTVSRLAQEMLLEMGVTLVLNVKPSVMERVARCTQAGIVSSIDAHLGRPHLGVCHHFRVQTFHLSGNKTKTLMFFDGCAANLGCTILLRGGSVAELKKVKQITSFMVYVAYNWRLERSFLMDEFALPPPHPDELPLIIESAETKKPERNDTKTESGELVKQSTPIEDKDEKLKTRPNSLSLKTPRSPEGESRMKDTADEIKKMESKFIEDFSDPLRSYLQSEDDSIFHHHGSSLHVASLPFSNQFRKALDDVVLCVSPNIKISVPYLETENGRNCELRHFFPEEIYWSQQFLKELEGSGKKNLYSDVDESSMQSYVTAVVNQENTELLPWHPFTFSKLTTSFEASLETQSMLADFRARGGRIRHLCPHELALKERDRKVIARGDSVVTGTSVKLDAPNSGMCWERRVDALSAYNHQRLAVLFCSYSNTSSNAPNFCVSPWVVNMDYYGCNDIPLGDFLEKYCFRPNYLCPSAHCDTPMTEHIRKFSHENGCVQILIHKLENVVPAAQNNILMWNWCQKCKLATPVVSMSQDTWSLSFAKYLELRFHGTLYNCRAGESCFHSLHHDYYQYFLHKQIIATFKYAPIIMREVALPPLVITIQKEPFCRDLVIEEVKLLQSKGCGLYSIILERLCALKSDCEDTKYEAVINEMMEQQKCERAIFREKIEEIQMKMTSPTLENAQNITLSPGNEHKERDAHCVMWEINDCIVLLKRRIATASQGWNSKIQDFFLARKKEEKMVTKVSQLKTLGISPQQSLINDQSDTGSNSSIIDDSVKDMEILNNAEMEILKSEIPASTISQNFDEISSKTAVNQNGKINVQVEGSTLHHSQSFDSQHSDRSSWRERSLSFSEITPSDNDVDVLNSEKEKASIPRVASAPSCLFDVTELLNETCEQQQKKLLPESCEEDAERRETAPDLIHGGSSDVNSKIYDENQYAVSASISKDKGIFEETRNRRHERSQSDEAEKAYDARHGRSTSRSRSIPPEEEVVGSNKPEKKERGTVKTIISQLLSNSCIAPICNPFPPNEHLLIAQSEKVPIIVYEQEPSSIIAYTLSSADYEQQLQELKASLAAAFSASQRESRNSSPLLKRRLVSKSTDNGTASSDTQVVGGELSPNYTKRAGMLSFFRGHERTSSKQKITSNAPMGYDAVQYSVGKSERESLDFDEVDFADFGFCGSQEGDKSSGKPGSKAPNFHVEIQFSEPSARFYCRVYFADQFRKLRRLVFPEGEECFIRSLSRCVPWFARGGKSGSSFCKTRDDRFILKQMSRLEVQSFLDFAPHYFQYINRACSEQKPTVLGKIVGVYRIGYKNTSTNAASKLDLLVMENLFYGRNITQKFDLKGSVRNRMVDTNNQEDDIVLLDENLLKMTCDCPLYIRPHSKTMLTLAINNDAQFLYNQSVMDYSLLVGLDDDKKELVVGIIDYIRTFTWDKKLEMVVKSSGILGGHGKLPTVVSPEMYRVRFCEAMDRYFLWVPDRWNGLGQGVDC